MQQINKIYPAMLIAVFICLAMMFDAYAYAADKNPCAEDIAKFCGNIKFGTPAMVNCLESHEGQLSAACREYEATMEGKRGERMEQAKVYAKFRQACSADIARFCMNADPKQGGAVKCLKGHANEISPACSDAVKMIDVEK
jgi:hypothetical protein